jgi:CRP/FNR family cyclic AMP-dependent transcriptional regulator
VSADTTPGTNLFKHDPDAVFVAEGAEVFRAGESGHEMYVVQDGAIELWFDGEVVERLGPGGIFGEMALVDGEHTRSGTARAAVDSRLAVIDERRFRYLCERSPFFPMEVMRAMAHRLRRTNERIWGSQSDLSR